MRAVASVLTRANSSGECARTDPAQCTRTEQPSTKAQRAAASSRSPGTPTVPGGRSAPGRRTGTRKDTASRYRAEMNPHTTKPVQPVTAPAARETAIPDLTRLLSGQRVNARVTQGGGR